LDGSADIEHEPLATRSNSKQHRAGAKAFDRAGAAASVNDQENPVEKIEARAESAGDDDLVEDDTKVGMDLVQGDDYMDGDDDEDWVMEEGEEEDEDEDEDEEDGEDEEGDADENGEAQLFEVANARSSAPFS
jgi:hypothetical protein